MKTSDSLIESRLSNLITRIQVILSADDKKNALLSIDDIALLTEVRDQHAQLLNHVSAAQASLMNAMATILNKGEAA